MQRMDATIQSLQREIKEIEGDLKQSGLSEGRRRAIEEGAKKVENVAIEGIQKRPIAQGFDLPCL